MARPSGGRSLLQHSRDFQVCCFNRRGQTVSDIVPLGSGSGRFVGCFEGFKITTEKHDSCTVLQFKTPMVYIDTHGYLGKII